MQVTNHSTNHTTSENNNNINNKPNFARSHANHSTDIGYVRCAMFGGLVLRDRRGKRRQHAPGYNSQSTQNNNNNSDSSRGSRTIYKPTCVPLQQRAVDVTLQGHFAISRPRTNDGDVCCSVICGLVSCHHSSNRRQGVPNYIQHLITTNCQSQSTQ